MYQSAPLWTEFYRRLDAAANKLVDPATGLVASRYCQRITCPVCNSHSFRQRLRKHGFTYVTCETCSFVYLNPQLTRTALEQVYNDSELRSFFFHELLLPFVERDQRVEFHQRLEFLRQHIGKESPSLLDVGCAAGNFLTLAAQKGFRGEGLELNSMYVEYAREHRSEIVIHHRSLEEMQYPHNRFDAVVLWDVLEHLPDPVGTLTHVHRITAPSGIVALTTINHDSINEFILKGRWRYYMPPDHVCSFTPQLLETILQRCGFQILRMEHHALFEILAGEWFPTWLSSPHRRLEKVMYSLIAGLYQSLANFFGRGDLLTVYARKT